MNDLEELEGVGSTTASKLRNSGFITIEAIAVTPARELSEKSGLGYNTALNITSAARKLVNVNFVTAKEVWEKRKEQLRISTGSENLDNMLGGGVETQALTELIGEFGSGKTQICLTLAVRSQLPQDEGGISGKALFIDTEGTFITDRVYQIAEASGLAPETVLENIFVARAYNSDHQCLLIDELFQICSNSDVKLVIVDSMISHFRGEYVGREHLAERQQKLNYYLHKLVRLSEAYNIAVVITNQVQANPAQFFGDPNKPAGGHVMAHASTHRIYLRKGKSNTRLARVIDSPCLPETSIRFRISEKGIENSEE
ncbi:MAG: DNA repair and recombination protein RadA [Candidatus Bathyarchaeota archaeon]